MRDMISKTAPFLLRRLVAQSPFIVMLACAFFGVADTSVSRHAMTLYWMVLVPGFGVICVVIAWRGARGEGEGWRAALFQALHWGAVTLAMHLALIADMEKAMSAEASALMLLVILALGTTTAGLHLRAWPVVVVGGVLAIGVPIFAWLEERTLLFALVGVAVAAAAAMLLAVRGRLLAPAEQ